jgi:tRNA pseudouridine38-40 synthase
MPRYKMTIEYDGTPFAGWQRQQNAPSAQQALEDALFRVMGEKMIVRGAGRTDSGVHATGQVAHPRRGECAYETAPGLCGAGGRGA